MPKSTPSTSPLRALRERAGFRSAREAALAFGWPIGTYQAHERAVRKMSPEQEAKYIQAFDSRPAALSTVDPNRMAFRLAVARRLRGFRSASAAVAHFKWKKSTYHSHEAGNAHIDADRAKLYADIAHPINSMCREMIQEVVVNEFFEEIERAKQPGYVSRYDDFEFEYTDVPRTRPARFDQPHVNAAEPPHARSNPKTPAPSDLTGKPHFRRDCATDSRNNTPAPPPPMSGNSFGAGIFSE